MMVYSDTSALAKLLLNEAGTAEMQATSRSAGVVASAAIAYVELRATLGSAMRDGRIPAALREQTVLAAERVWSNISEIPVDGPLLRRAGDLAERMGLRGYDAVHLASLIQCGTPAEVTFACWDRDLRRAARELGYSLFPD